MSIVFYCQSCGSRFEVDDRLAGKKAACRKCGQRTTIPKAEHLASMMAMPAMRVDGAAAAKPPEPASPRLTPLAEPARAAPGARPAPASANVWSSSVVSNAQLAPLTIVGMRRGLNPAAKATPLDDDNGSALYALAPSRKRLLPIGRSSSRPNFLKMFWRRELGGVQKLLRWLGDAAYLVSVPFLVLIFLGVAVKNRPVALFGAAVAIALNLGRFAVGFFNLAVIHFKRGLIQGILFLIPPITLVFLATEWNKLRKATRRVVEPAVTIAVVVAAFLLVPWLRHGGHETGSLQERLRGEAGELRKDLRGEVESAKDLDLDKLREKAKGKLAELEKSLSDDDGPTRKSGTRAQSKSAEQSLGGKLQILRDEIRKQVSDDQDQQ
jgi:hypothetical protein